MKLIFRLWIVALAIGSMPMGALADVLILKDGTRLEGRVESSSAGGERLSFLNGSGQIELPANRVVERIDEPDAADWTHVGNQFLAVRNYGQAVIMYQRALEAEPSHAGARTGLKEAQDAIALEQEDRARQVQQQLDTELDQITQMLADGDYRDDVYTKTEQRLNKVMTMAEASDTQRQRAQRLMRDLYLAWGFALFDRLDYKGAEDKYVRVQEMDPNNKDAREKLLRIWENDPTKREEVLKVYQRQLAEDPNNIELNKKVADMLYGLRRYEEALEPLGRIAASPRFAGQGYNVRLRNAFSYAIDEAQSLGELERAAGMLRKMVSLGLTQNTTQLRRIEYELAVQALPDASDYWTLRARLAKEMLGEAGLSDYREKELELVLRNEPENVEALSGFREIADAKIARIEEAMRLGEFIVAKELAEQFLFTEGRFADLTERATQLRNSADIEATEQLKQQKEAARRVAENAMQFYDRARSDIDSMIAQERLNAEASGRSFNYMSFKESAIRNARNAVDRYQLAIKMDPTLGRPDSMDLNTKLAEARALYASLVEPGRPLPKVRNR